MNFNIYIHLTILLVAPNRITNKKCFRFLMASWDQLHRFKRAGLQGLGGGFAVFQLESFETHKHCFLMTIGTCSTLAGLLNAMIGGTMLVIPVLALTVGYLDWLFGCIVICCITCYTAYLLVQHLGKAKNIKYLILNHFGGNNKCTIIYNIVIWFSFCSAMLIYFQLFCLQVTGLIGPHPFLHEILAGFLMLWVIALRNCDMNELVLASGLISIVAYMFFLVWTIGTSPEGEKSLPVYSGDSSALMLALLNSYTVHDFMIQLITANPNRKQYSKIVILMYLIGNLVFLFTAFSSIGLINRSPGASDPETIIDFFSGSVYQSWTLAILQIVYILHILSTFPEYVVISKIRIFQLANIQHDHKSPVTLGELIYIFIVIGLCYLIKKLHIPLTLILDISGAVLGYIFSMLIPILIHLKCVHVDHSSGQVEGDDERNFGIIANECECKLTYRSNLTLWLQTFLLLFVVIYGAVFFFGELKKEIQNLLAS